MPEHPQHGGPIAALILWLMGAAGSAWWLWAWGAWVGFALLMIAAAARIARAPKRTPPAAFVICADVNGIARSSASIDDSSAADSSKSNTKS